MTFGILFFEQQAYATALPQQIDASGVGITGGAISNLFQCVGGYYSGQDYGGQEITSLTIGIAPSSTISSVVLEKFNAECDSAASVASWTNLATTTYTNDTVTVLFATSTPIILESGYDYGFYITGQNGQTYTNAATNVFYDLYGATCDSSFATFHYNGGWQYNCINATFGQPYPLYFYFNSLAPASPTFDFVYPHNGSTTDSFDAYNFHFSNLVPTHSYTVRLQSQWIGAPPAHQMPSYVNDYAVTTIGSTGQQFLNRGGRIAYFPYQFGVNLSDTINVSTTAYLYDDYLTSCTQYNSDYCKGLYSDVQHINFNQNLFSVSTTTLQINPTISTSSATSTWNGDFTIGTTTNPYFNAPTPQNISTACVPAADWTDIGGGLRYAGCETLNFLFVPPDFATAQLEGAIVNMQSVPPFSWFFQVSTDVQTIADTTSTAVGLTTPSIPIPFGGTTTLQILPADPMTNSYLSTIADIWYNFLLGIGCMAILLTIIKFIF